MFKPTTKFLIVDDFASMRKIIKNVLIQLGFHNLIEAVDGHNAYELLTKHSKTTEPFDFIIADWNMPNMSGLELLIKCRNEEPFKKIPFMMVTAENEQSQIIKACNVGVTEYVIKPFSPAKLKEKLESSFKKSNSSLKVAA